jgi:hypothetical protein
MDYAKAGVLVRGAPDREMLMLLGAAGVTHVVTYRAAWDKLGPPIATLPGAFTQPLLVYRNPFALPRVRLVPQLTPYETLADFTQAVRSAPDDVFLHTAFVERRDLQAIGPAAGEGGTASLTSDDGDSIKLQVDGPGGYAVVSDAFAPGWQASVDGQPAPILRVDLAFRAVPVPAGVARRGTTLSAVVSRA